GVCDYAAGGPAASGGRGPGGSGPGAVAAVTGSTAYRRPELAGGIIVVPLTAGMGGIEGGEGDEVTPAEVAAALTGRRVAVTTSRPSPERLARCYRAALAGGAAGVVSVHLSAKLSATYEGAVLAAAEVDPERI